MVLENRLCQSCQQSFVIEPEDFAFYERIKVPPPTWCPSCQLQRRMSYRNERSLYKRKCSAPSHNEDLVSIYSDDKNFTVYDPSYWWSDNWDPLDYGRDYNFNKPFFLQYRELLEKVPLISSSVTNLSNCSYCNVSADDKGCYLIFASENNENVFYSNRVIFNKDSMDLLACESNELCYEAVSCDSCYRVFFGFNSFQCRDSVFLYNCVNCFNCFGCANLKNKSYYIFNKPYSKEEYLKEMKKMDFGSFIFLNKIKQEYRQFLIRQINKFANILKSVNSIGDNIINAKNCFNCFDILGDPSVENGKNLVLCGAVAKDVWNAGPGAGIGLEQGYEIFDSGHKSNNLLFTGVVYGSYNVSYSINCHGSHDLFGCYGLRNKEYCILNKQYTKQEYESLVPKIIDHMNKMPYIDKKGLVYKYGEFFPPELSPFAYNETIAQEYFPLTKEQALAQGYRWKDPEERNIKPDYYTKDLADHIKDVKDDILGKIIQCAHSQIKEDGSLEANCNEQCTTAFKIIPQELEFYRRMNLPLPRLCPNCRHFQRLKQRNPLKLWHRKCQCQGTYGQNPNNSNIYQNQTTHFHQNKPCSNEFYTSYAPDRPEIVYCDKCYQAEVV